MFRIKSIYWLSLIFICFSCGSTRSFIVSSKPGEKIKNAQAAAGATAGTKIQWLVNSTPKNANVYWKVVSNTDEVSNTGEIFLGKTPVEKTSDLKIKGLTEQNSAKVNIEVIVKLDKYFEQKRRFVLKEVLDVEQIGFDLNLKKK